MTCIDCAYFYPGQRDEFHQVKDGTCMRIGGPTGSTLASSNVCADFVEEFPAVLDEGENAGN